MDVYAVQIINISSTLGSIGTLQGSLDAPEGSFPATLSHYHLAYRSSKAALNMREHPDTLRDRPATGRLGYLHLNNNLRSFTR